MWTLLLATSAIAGPITNPDRDEPLPDEPVEKAVEMGRLTFDSRLPAEIQVDRQTVAQLYLAAEFSIMASVGTHKVTVLTNGVPRQVDVNVPRMGEALVVVGKTGLTTSNRIVDLPPGTEVALELRVAGRQDVLVQIDNERHHVNGNGVLNIEIPVGSHKMSVRSGNGTIVWATGTLELL